MDEISRALCKIIKPAIALEVKNLDLRFTNMDKFKTIYTIIKVAIYLTSSFAMTFAISFNMLSQEQLVKLIKEDLVNFFFTKFLSGLTVGFVFFISSLLINLAFRKRHKLKKKTILKLAFYELAYLIIFCVTVTTIIVRNI